MGLFGNKNVQFRLMHYEGLAGFPTDHGVDFNCSEDQIAFKAYKQDATATLSISQITGVELLPETEYMQRYKGTVSAPNNGNYNFMYYVLNYTASDGQNKSITFRGVNSVKATDYWGKLKQQLASDINKGSYSL